MDGSASWRGAPEQRGKTEGIGISALDGRARLWCRRAAQGRGETGLGAVHRPSTFLEQVAAAIRVRHYSIRMEERQYSRPPAVREATLTYPTSTLAQVPARALGVEVIAMGPLVHVQDLQGIDVLDPAGTLSELPRRHRSLQAYARRSSSPRMVNPCSTTRGGWA